jgi:hypothetical protein
MTPEQTAALVQSRVARALIRLESMRAANIERQERGYSLAYGEGAFLAVIDDEGIGENAVLLALRGEQL